MAVHVLVLRAPGTNCDEETVYAFERAGAAAVRVHVARVRENPAIVDQYQILALPGGFTYGDDLGAGKILGNEIRFHLAEALGRHLARGRLVLGICNGFQALVRAGLLPGGEGSGRATLAFNDSGRFEARWVHLEVVSDRTPFFKKGARLFLPCAHGEGKFVAEDLGAIERSGQVVLRYVDREGRRGPYPVNPNGSDGDVAGICDPTGRVLGLMPHPERHVESYHHPRWTRRPRSPEGEADGLEVFRNAVRYFG